MNTKHAIYRALKAAPLKVIAVIAAPLVFLGAYNVIRDARNNDIYAVDPLIVTYNGGPPPNPVFIVTNMLPGDEIEKEFNGIDGKYSLNDIFFEDQAILEALAFHFPEEA